MKYELLIRRGYDIAKLDTIVLLLLKQTKLCLTNILPSLLISIAPILPD